MDSHEYFPCQTNIQIYVFTWYLYKYLEAIYISSTPDCAKMWSNCLFLFHWRDHCVNIKTRTKTNKQKKPHFWKYSKKFKTILSHNIHIPVTKECLWQMTQEVYLHFWCIVLYLCVRLIYVVYSIPRFTSFLIQNFLPNV